MNILTKSKSNSLIFFLNYTLISTSPKSYYEILQVPRTADPKQIRKSFLQKARQLHPDHNQSPQAQQQFKILKQAYEHLKDPQKRYIYDTGINNQDVHQGNYTESEYQHGTGAKKYYQNKWYNFRKNTYEDQRDQYWERKSMGYSETENQVNKMIRIFGILLVVGGFFLYDYLYRRESEIDRQNKQIKKVLESSAQDKKTRRIRRYIQQRSKANTVE